MVGFVAPVAGKGAELSSLRTNFKCFFICLLIAVSNFQYGFDTAIMNGFQAMQGFLRVFGVEGPSGLFEIQTTFQQLITSLLQVGLVIASLGIGPFSTYFGRRAGFAVASFIAIVGVTIQIVVTTQWPLYIGRFLCGIANGIYVNMTVLYISEAAPAHLRGLMVAVFQPFVSLGSLMGAIVNNIFHNDLSKLSYQVQLAILYAVPLWLLVIAVFIPESPRWLAVQGEYEDAAQSLVRLRPRSSSSELLSEELKEIREAIEMERKISSTEVWKDMWKGPDLRRTLLSTACAIFHAASGANVLVGYGTFFFSVAGASRPFIDSIILQSISLFMALWSLPLARRFGRRQLLLAGFSICTVTMFIIAIVSTVSPTAASSGRLLVGMLCIFLGAYSATIGPLSWVTSGEMASNHLRSYTFGIGMAVGFVFAWLTTFTTPFFINTTALNLGGKVAWIWAPSNLITLIFIYFFLPETKGRSLEELDGLFYNRVSAREFLSYHGQDSNLNDSTISEDGLKDRDEKGSEHVEELVTVL